MHESARAFPGSRPGTRFWYRAVPIFVPILARRTTHNMRPKSGARSSDQCKERRAEGRQSHSTHASPLVFPMSYAKPVCYGVVLDYITFHIYQNKQLSSGDLRYNCPAFPLHIGCITITQAFPMHYPRRLVWLFPRPLPCLRRAPAKANTKRKPRIRLGFAWGTQSEGPSGCPCSALTGRAPKQNAPQTPRCYHGEAKANAWTTGANEQRTLELCQAKTRRRLLSSGPRERRSYGER